jgi:hypothetical protein
MLSPKGLTVREAATSPPPCPAFVGGKKRKSFLNKRPVFVPAIKSAPGGRAVPNFSLTLSHSQK